MKLHNVNTTDIADAIRMGCRAMSSVFNADDDDIPFFRSAVLPTAELGFNGSHSESHVPGRHLNALLNAEDVLGEGEHAGTGVAELVIEKHTRAALFSYSGPLPLPLNRARIGGPLVNFLPHNLREGFHALYALVKFRNSSKARELAEASIDAIFRYWGPEGGWDRDSLEGRFGLKVIEWGGPFITGIARTIGPLVKYYRATGYGPALRLALLLKEEVTRSYFTEQGEYNTLERNRFGTHTHSATCTMSSLAQLADLMHDAPLMQRVKAFYDHGLWDIRDALGWVIENSGPDADPDRGEVNNTGDILETALLLGRWGYVDGYHDAERILRGHLLPSQLRDTSFIQDPLNPAKEDGKRDVAQRHVGAFGFPAPYGHEPIGCDEVSFNMDIVGGAVGSLCEAYRDVTRLDEAGLWINLLFDHETDAVKIESPYTHPSLRVTVKRPIEPAAVLLRLPPWCANDIASDIDRTGRNEMHVCSDGRLLIGRPKVGESYTVPMPLQRQDLTLRHRTREIRVAMRGDAVVAMQNFGARLTYFDPLDG